MRFSGTFNWFIHRLTGIILFAGLSLHFYLMHFSGQENLAYEAVMTRFQNPLWILFYIVFLASACYHGFNGLWGVTLEYVRSERWLEFARYAYAMAGVILVAVGVYILTLA